MMAAVRSSPRQWRGLLVALRAALCGLICLAAAAASGAVDTTKGDTGRVLLTLAGVEVLTATIIPEFARSHLERYGANGIKVEPAAAPWSFKVTGRMTSGEAVSVLVRTSSSEDGLERLIKGEVDIALTTRQANLQEIEASPALAEDGDEAAFKPIAHAAVVTVVNPDNPVTKLTFDQLQGVFAGSIKDWAELGGPAGPIHPYEMTAEPAARELFQSIVLGSYPVDGDIIRHVTGSEDLRRALLNDPAGISYIAVPGGLKLLNIEVEPGRTTSPPNTYQLTSKDYPLTQTLFMYRNPKSTNPGVNAFFRAALSVPAQFKIISAGLSYIGPQLILPVQSINAPAPYVDLANRSLRVNLTIRFADASMAIDKSASYLLDLAASYLRILRSRPDHIVLAAFSDESGDPDKDRAVSEQLGRIVADELKKRLVATSDILALGSAVPLANNVTPAGRGINRRVEIWLRP